jgi:4-amino-4-deoxy-L-arabinose transferase-like glycosyltransferase
MNSRAQHFGIVLLVWAAIYLPALGSLEIKGEEGRRILPAVMMLQTGNYLVPQVGSEPYLAKPPLVNWLVATSFKIFGLRNEWTARLPSALGVLAVALAFIIVARASLGAAGSLVAALIWLTNFGIIEKGRLIEIEALYVSLCGLAFIFWLSAWEQKKSPWLIWIPASIFLGLGLLAKGPVHLIFFYAIVIAVLWRARELRLLASWAHLGALIIMIAIFAAWAVPYVETMRTGHVTHAWSSQFSGRILGAGIKFESWAMNIPRSLGYFLPWLLLLPLVAGAKFSSERKIDIVRGLSWGAVISLLIVDLIPGALPRYTLPLLVPASWLLAMTLTADEVRWPSWLGGELFQWRDRQRVIATVVIVACVCISIYAFALVPRLQTRQKVKNVAAKIDSLVPAGERLYAVDPEYQPFLFYVHAPLSYASRVEDLPRDTHYFLVQPENEHVAGASMQWLPQRPQTILRIQDYRNRKVILFEVR